MAKVKFDVSGSDPEKARAGSGEAPRPGVYPALIKEINPGFSKDETTGKPDKTRPRVEVVFSLNDEKHKGFPLWLYLTFGESAIWKYDQFLQAMGIADDKTRKGEWETTKYIGKACRVRVKAGSTQAGDYRPEVGAVLPPGEGDDTVGPFDDSDFTDMGGDVIDADSTEVTEDDSLWTEADLMKLTVPELKETAKLYEVPISGKKKGEVVDAILQAQQAQIDAAAAGGDDEMLGDDDDIIEDDTDTGLTEEQLNAMDIPTLKETAKQYEVVLGGGKKKSEVIAEILAKQSGSSDDGDLPF